MAELKRGQKVNIYEDPLTCKKLEGRARLLEFLGGGGVYEGRSVTRWMVKFDGDSKPYQRTICPQA